MEQQIKNPQRGVRIGFAAFEVSSDPEIHISIGRRYDATEDELIEMQQFIDTKIKPYLPSSIIFGNFCHMGENGTFPAYRVSFTNGILAGTVDWFYECFYKEAPGKALYPNPKFHVTVDTPAKREFIETMIRTRRVMQLTNVLFKTRIEGGNVEITDTTWRCQICEKVNPLTQRNCLTAGCDQWRPLHDEKERYGDWICPYGCGVNNFGSRTQCMKCNRPKDAISVYEIPPPSAPIARGGYKPDWWCMKCQFNVFGKKDRCSKCNTLNPN